MGNRDLVVVFLATWSTKAWSKDNHDFEACGARTGAVLIVEHLPEREA